MLKCFYPDEYKMSTYVIPFEQLYDEGIRGVIFDVDNTLVPHDAPVDDRARKLFQNLKELGIVCCLMSNNGEERVKAFADQVGVRYIYKAQKPLVKNYLKAVGMLGTTKESTLFVGDQLFTDVWGAKRAGIRNILVKPMDPREEIQIVLKRRLEKIVLKSYEKEKA